VSCELAGISYLFAFQDIVSSFTAILTPSPRLNCEKRADQDEDEDGNDVDSFW
jgi:hypothetical protein